VVINLVSSEFGLQTASIAPGVRLGRQPFIDNHFESHSKHNAILVTRLLLPPMVDLLSRLGNTGTRVMILRPVVGVRSRLLLRVIRWWSCGGGHHVRCRQDAVKPAREGLDLRV
jgi:hypothetical protein